MQKIDIIVPVRNEAPNVGELVRRIFALKLSPGFKFDLIFEVDPSTDGTVAALKKLSKDYPIRIEHKTGKPGKAFSILEGVKRSTADYILMLDGDLQYPPEAIPEMLAKIPQNGLVVANRKNFKSSFLRRLMSRFNRFAFGRLLLGLNCDVQSGMKLFRREIAGYLDEKKIGAWSLDIPLIFTALELGYSVDCVDITFEERKQGVSKVSFLPTIYQIVSGALRLRFIHPKVYLIPTENGETMSGAGVVYRRKRFVTHTTLSHEISALETLVSWQKLFLILLPSLIV